MEVPTLRQSWRCDSWRSSRRAQDESLFPSAGLSRHTSDAVCESVRLGGSDGYARTSWTTRPETSVSRKFRPWNG